jgi:hypothetical protein
MTTTQAQPVKIIEQQNIGHAKYVVSYYTGKKHSDGSDFYDIRIFKNLKAKNDFLTSLIAHVFRVHRVDRRTLEYLVDVKQ